MKPIFLPAISRQLNPPGLPGLTTNPLKYLMVNALLNLKVRNRNLVGHQAENREMTKLLRSRRLTKQNKTKAKYNHLSRHLDYGNQKVSHNVENNGDVSPILRPKKCHIMLKTI